MVAGAECKSVPAEVMGSPGLVIVVASGVAFSPRQGNRPWQFHLVLGATHHDGIENGGAVRTDPEAEIVVAGSADQGPGRETGLEGSLCWGLQVS